MIAIESFKQHHKELLLVATEITRLLNTEALKKDSSAVRSQLSKLAGKLSVHLAMEDKSLYPLFLNHKNEMIKETVSRFMQEMGGIKDAFMEYNRKWTMAVSIQNDPEAFIRETKGIFAALAKRIDKEDKELYTLVMSQEKMAI